MNLNAEKFGMDKRRHVAADLLILTEGGVSEQNGVSRLKVYEGLRVCDAPIFRSYGP